MNTLDLSKNPKEVHKWRSIEPIWNGPFDPPIGVTIGPWNVEVDGVLVVRQGETLIDHPAIHPWFRSSPYSAGEPLKEVK